jgi:hydroxymethylglutaryl-CoA lyase
MSRAVQIVEVGPRDGLQNETALFTVAQKVEFIARLEAAGVRRLEAVSFVNPKRVPQMAGAEEVMAALPPDPSRSRIGLALNLRGWERAAAAGCDEVNLSVSASEGFGLRNQGMTLADQARMIEEVAARSAETPGAPALSITLSVVWGDPFDGEVSEAAVVEVVRRAAAAGYREIALADTIGAADPWTVRRRIEAARAAAPDARLRVHFHDTRRTGLANAYAAVEVGVDVLDASCGGIGGCPFAPRATGNIATEDLVYMLERGGFSTGLDLDALIRTAEWLEGPLGKRVPSGLRGAGRFPG